MKSFLVTRNILVVFSVITVMTLWTDISIAQTNLTIGTKLIANKGDSFSAAINVANVTNLAGFQLDIAFNPAILEAVKVEQGSFLAGASGAFCIDPKIDNTAGKITDIACVRTIKGGVNGSGILTTITFKANSIGQSYIRFQNVRLSDASLPSPQVITATATDSTITVIAFPRWDVNQDAKVDILDLVLVGQRFGETITTPSIPNPDVDDNGRVDLADLVLIGQNFGKIY